MNKLATWVASAAILVLAFYSLVGNAPGAKPPQSIQSPGYSSVLGSGLGAASFRDYGNGIGCSIHVVFDSQTLGFEWRHAPGYQLGDDPSVLYSSESLWYWPNYVEWISDADLIVAGVSPRDGSTVIERWTYDTDPNLPSVTQVTDDQGNIKLNWDLPSRLSVKQVWSSSSSSPGPVTYAKENLADSSKVFIRFLNSPDVNELDLTNGAMSVVAASQPGSPMTIPELAAPVMWEVGGAAVEHAAEGFVYLFSSNWRMGETVQHVFLIDQDRDGLLDTYSTSDPAGYYMGDSVLSTH